MRLENRGFDVAQERLDIVLFVVDRHDERNETHHHSPLTTHHSPLATHHSPLTTTQIFPYSTCCRTHGMTVSSISLSDVVAVKASTRLALATSGTRFWTS